MMGFLGKLGGLANRAGKTVWNNPTARHAAIGGVAGGVAGGMGDDGSVLGSGLLGAGIGALGGRFGAGRGYGAKLGGMVSRGGGRMYRGGFGMMEGRAGYLGVGMSGLGQGMSRFGRKLAANDGFYGDVALTAGAAASASLIGNTMMNSNQGY